MKPVKLFYLRSCPFCKKALRYIDEARAAHPELAAVGIEMIEESEQPEVADAFDYYYVPTFYVDGVKVHEGGIYPEEIKGLQRDYETLWGPLSDLLKKLSAIVGC